MTVATESKRDLCIQMRDSGMKWQQISDELDIPTSTLYDWYKAETADRVAVIDDEPELTPEQYDQIAIQVKDFDWRDALDKYSATAELQRTFQFDKEFTVDQTAYDGEWFGLMFSADWHLGSMHVDMQRFRQDMEEIMDTPGLQMSVVGDAIDNFVISKLKFAMLNASIPVFQQKLILLNLLKELAQRDSIMNFVLGNHEMFDESVSGDHVLRYLDLPVKVSDNRAVIDLKFSGSQYKIVEVHKSKKGNSMYNKLHSNIREMREGYPDADVIASAHTHTPAYMKDSNYGRWQYYIRCGTYKLSDEFTWRWWGDAERVWFPIVAFNTTRKEMKMCEGIDDFKRLAT